MSDSQNRRGVVGDYRLVFHALNTVGLGHLSRLSAIAVSLRKRLADAACLFLVEGNSHGLLEAYELPYLSMPNRAGHDTCWAGWPVEQKERLRSVISRSILDTVRPNLIIFDTALSDPILAYARESSVPFVVCARVTKQRDYYSVKLLDRLRDASLIIVAHEAGEVDIPDELLSKTKFVGPILRSPLSPSPDSPDDLTVTIVGGGGGYPDTVSFYNLALEAVRICSREVPELRGLLITGPLFEDWGRLRMVEQVRVLPFEPDIYRTFSASQLVICQGGYNTLAEVSTVGVAAICIPAERKLDDQRSRAQAFAAANDTFIVCEQAEPRALAALVLKCLLKPQTFRRAQPPPPGADLAADALLEVVRQSSAARARGRG